MKLYHTTLSKNCEAIEREGLKLNTSKANRPTKSFTDIFNYVFNEKSKLYLPENMQDIKVDRNSVIFLSAHPGEFKKSENLSHYSREEDKVDVTYSVDINRDLPVFDSDDFTNWTDGLAENLNKLQVIQDYLAISGKDEVEEERMFFDLMKYFINGDSRKISQHGLGKAQLETLSKLRGTVLDYTARGVEVYSKNGLPLSNFTKNFGFEKNEDGSYSWYGEHNNQPRKIGTLEILCNEAIPAEKLEIIK
jgi:hypothetical protein